MDPGFFKDLLGPGESRWKDSFITAQKWSISLRGNQANVSENASVNEHGAFDLRHIKDCRWRWASY